MVCAKRVRPIIGVANNSREKFYNFTCSSHRISVLIGLRQDFVIRKLVRKLRINIEAALRRFRKICCLNQSQVDRYSRDNSYSLFALRSDHCGWTVLSFLSGPLLKQESISKEMNKKRKCDTLP